MAQEQTITEVLYWAVTYMYAHNNRHSDIHQGLMMMDVIVQIELIDSG